MSDALTPQLAVAYLAELEPALAQVSISDHEGRLLAGEDVERGAAAAGDVVNDATSLTAASERHSITATAAPAATILDALARLDLETALADMERVPA